MHHVTAHFSLFGFLFAIDAIIVGCIFTYHTEQWDLLNLRKSRYYIRWGSLAGFDVSAAQDQELLP